MSYFEEEGVTHDLNNMLVFLSCLSKDDYNDIACNYIYRIKDLHGKREISWKVYRF